MLIFVVQGYESQSDTGTLSDIVTIELIDTTTESAIERAKSLIQKKFWRLSNVIEKKDADNTK